MFTFEILLRRSYYNFSSFSGCIDSSNSHLLKVPHWGGGGSGEGWGRGEGGKRGVELDEEDLVQVLGFLVTGALNSYFCFQVEMSLSGMAWVEGKDPTLRSLFAAQACLLSTSTIFT